MLSPYHFFYHPNFSLGRNIKTLHNYVCCIILFRDLFDEIMPKSPISNEFPWCWNSMMQKYRFQTFDLGLNLKLPTGGELLRSKLFDFFRSIRILIVQNLQSAILKDWSHCSNNCFPITRSLISSIKVPIDIFSRKCAFLKIHLLFGESLWF